MKQSTFSELKDLNAKFNLMVAKGPWDFDLYNAYVKALIRKAPCMLKAVQAQFKGK